MISENGTNDALTTRVRDAVETLLEQDDTSYTELTVGAICLAAGISRPTFYSRFKDKAELIRVMANDIIAELVDVSASWLDAPKGTRSQLNQAMTQLATAYAPHRRLMAAAAEVAAYDGDLRREYQSAVERAARRVAAHIREEQIKGSVRAGLDPVATARWLGWMTERGLRRTFASGATAAPTAIAALTDVHWFTLYDEVS